MTKIVKEIKSERVWGDLENIMKMFVAFAQPILLKFLFQNKNIKLISKNVNLKKNSHKILIKCV